VRRINDGFLILSLYNVRFNYRSLCNLLKIPFMEKYRNDRKPHENFVFSAGRLKRHLAASTAALIVFFFSNSVYGLIKGMTIITKRNSHVYVYQTCALFALRFTLHLRFALICICLSKTLYKFGIRLLAIVASFLNSHRKRAIYELDLTTRHV
jgi:hypothetical protein